MDVDQFYQKSVSEKREEILDGSKSITIPAEKTIPPELEQTFKIARFLDTFLEDYFKLRISFKKEDFNEESKRKEMFSEYFKNFAPQAIDALTTQFKKYKSGNIKPKNVYELGGAYSLAFGNNATRTLSTKMGLFWEKLAGLSPYVINPESEFGIKITGVDAIVFETTSTKWHYIQIKTQRNTLTGSQKGRSVAELKLHQNRIFCVCFDVSNWTFSDPDIPRLSGTEFWKFLGFDFSEIDYEFQKLLKKLDSEYVLLLKQNLPEDESS